MSLSDSLRNVSKYVAACHGSMIEIPRDAPLWQDLREAAAELKRFRRDYELFEEISPPDVSRSRFVGWCFEAWEKAAEQTPPDEAEDAS